MLGLESRVFLCPRFFRAYGILRVGWFALALCSQNPVNCSFRDKTLVLIKLCCLPHQLRLQLWHCGACFSVKESNLG